MNEQETHRQPLQLMEYLYLLPAILAISPLWVAYQTTKGQVTQEQLIFAFRLMSLGWMWMLTAIILYYWRPILRAQSSFVMNVLRATVLGGIALTPVIFGGELAKIYAQGVELFSGLEMAIAWLAYLGCAAANLFFLRFGMASEIERKRLKGWNYYSAGFLIIVVLVVIAAVIN